MCVSMCVYVMVGAAGVFTLQKKAMKYGWSGGVVVSMHFEFRISVMSVVQLEHISGLHG